MNYRSQDLSKPLFLIRVGIFLVMFMWTLDKFVRPEHAQNVFKNFYFLESVSTPIMYILGSIEMVLIFGFLLGIRKKLTYGFVLIIHAISTLSSFKQYLSPFEGASLLFFAAWPMLAACYALYTLRDHDSFFSLN